MCISSFCSALLAFATLVPASAYAESIVIMSPDKAQTFVQSRADKERLYWNADKQMMYADITFSNELYSGGGFPNDAPRQDYYLFSLPGVQLNSDGKTFVAATAKGVTVPVAMLQPTLFGHYVKLLPGTRVFILRHHGEAHVLLKASTEPQVAGVASHWIQIDDGFTLKNLVTR